MRGEGRLNKASVPLAPLYKELLSKGKEASLPSSLWKEWLWGSDCTAMGTEAAGDMSRMHALGLLLSLAEASKWTDDETCLHSLLPSVPLVHLYRKPITHFSLRELTSQAECLQLSWGCVLSHCEWERVSEALLRLMGRLGQIAHCAFPEKDVNMDDPQYVTPLQANGGQRLLIVTRKYIRQMVCILLILFRFAYVWVEAYMFQERICDPQTADHYRLWSVHRQRLPLQTPGELSCRTLSSSIMLRPLWTFTTCCSRW